MMTWYLHQTMHARSLAFFCSAALIACAGVPSPEAEGEGSLAAHERIWEEAGIDSYQYSFQQQCFCVREQTLPVTVEVRGGRIERVIAHESGMDFAGHPNLRWYTVSELFSLVREAEASNREPLIVRYDRQLGYPTHIEVGSLAADAGVVYSASELRPL